MDLFNFRKKHANKTNKQDSDKFIKERGVLRRLLLDYLKANDYLNEDERNTYLSDILNLIAYVC